MFRLLVTTTIITNNGCSINTIVIEFIDQDSAIRMMSRINDESNPVNSSDHTVQSAIPLF